MHSLSFQNIRVDPVNNLYHAFDVGVEVLRLDLIHPHISGNKWFKLKEYLKEAQERGKNVLLTFGGAYSNHIAATAAACREAGLQSIGIIRGERPPTLSHTLTQALDKGMHLYFVSRSDYKDKLIPQQVWQQYSKEEVYVVDEGGYGIKGREGAASILDYCELGQYSHIIAAAGTGTTLAGLVTAALPHQAVLGVSVLKNYFDLEKEVNTLLPEQLQGHFSLHHDYHFGGYAKANATLFSFMNRWYEQTGIPSDFVYTGKLFYALDDLVRKSYFPAGSRVLAIHSGGLQGNLSLSKGTLIF